MRRTAASMREPELVAMSSGNGLRQPIALAKGMGAARSAEPNAHEWIELARELGQQVSESRDSVMDVC
jgi:hypothetical protein